MPSRWGNESSVNSCSLWEHRYVYAINLNALQDSVNREKREELTQECLLQNSNTDYKLF